MDLGPTSFCLLGLVLSTNFYRLYVASIDSQFEMKTKDCFKYGFLMANKHLLTTIVSDGFFVVGAVYVCLMVNMGLLLNPGAAIAAALLERVFKNDMPSEDEELEEEELEGFRSGCRAAGDY